MMRRDILFVIEMPFMDTVAGHLAEVVPQSLRANVINVGKILEKLGGKRLGQKRMPDETKPTVWAMRRPELWEQATETKIADTYMKPFIEIGGEMKSRSLGF